MAKQNSFIARMEAAYTRKAAAEKLHALQMAEDAAVVTLNQIFGFGQDRIEKFCIEFNRNLNEMAEKVNEAHKDDKDIAFYWDKLDRILKPIYGRNFQPYYIRYGTAMKMDGYNTFDKELRANGLDPKKIKAEDVAKMTMDEAKEAMSHGKK